MLDSDLRPPLVPGPVLGFAKNVLGLIAVTLAVAGGIATFVVAAVDVWNAWYVMTEWGDPEAESKGTADTIVYVVKSIDALLLGLVQFLLAAFLWQILDPADSMLNDENMVRLEEAKQMLCKVVLVIVAVRMLGEVIDAETLRWEHMIMPAGIIALAYATRSLKANATGTRAPAAPQ